MNSITTEVAKQRLIALAESKGIQVEFVPQAVLTASHPEGAEAWGVTKTEVELRIDFKNFQKGKVGLVEVGRPTQIQVSEALSLSAQVLTLAHESTHALVHSAEGIHGNTAELEATLVAVWVAEALGVNDADLPKDMIRQRHEVQTILKECPPPKRNRKRLRKALTEIMGAILYGVEDTHQAGREVSVPPPLQTITERVKAKLRLV